LQGKKKAPNGAFAAVIWTLARQYVDPLPFFVHAVIADNPIDLGEQREVATHTDILSWMNTRAQLADDYVACAHGLAAKYLNAATLPLAVATVA
jgi:hypothetical protein